MFGGLEIKGDSGAEGKKDADDNKASAPAPSTSLSGFGFLNGGASSAAAPAPAPALSSFSFLNPTPTPAPAPPANVPDPAPAAAPATGISGFSFMQTDTSTAATTGETATESEPSAAPMTSVDTAPQSGFDFLIPTPENDKTEENKDVISNNKDETSNAAPMMTGSAFSFMGAASNNVSEDKPSEPANAAMASTTTTLPTMTAASTTTSSTAPSISTPSPSLPAGAGMTFAPIGAKKTKKKKKTRAQQVGVGAAANNTASTMSMLSTPSTAKPETMASQVPDAPTRDAAEDAARRADEFMMQKEKEQLRSQASTTESIPSYGDTPAAEPSPTAVHPTASTDEEVAAAEAAAEEAKAQMMAKSTTTTTSKGFMGGLFKGFGNNAGAAKNSSGITKGSDNATASTLRRSPPTVMSSTSVAEKTSAVDHLAKQQQEMKRAAAERQYEMQQQQQDTKVDGGYKPQLPPPTSLEPKKMQTFNLAPKYDAASNQTQPQTSISTSKERMEGYQELFARSVQLGMDKVTNIYNQRSALLEEKVATLAKENLAAQQISQAELQLEQAAEQEDYELADQLGQVVQSHQQERDQMSRRLVSITKTLETLDAKSVVQGVAECFQVLSSQLKELYESEHSKEVKDDSEALKAFASIAKQLSAENDRLQKDLKHLEREEQFVAEERNDLETSISEKSGQFEKQRDSAKEKLTQAEKEIEELRKQLTAKQEMAAGLRTEIYGLEDSVSKVRLTFSRQLTRVEKKERSIEENRNEWEAEKAGYDREKVAHELQVEAHSNALLAQEELMRALESEMELAGQFATLVTADWGSLDGDSDTKNENKEDTTGAELQAKVAECEACVSKAQVLLKTTSDALMHLEAEQKSLEAKIPQLESLKKAAAAKRDFKAASKASKELKEATSRKVECEEELTLATQRKTIAQDECTRVDAELVEAQRHAHEHEGVAARAKMVELSNQLKHIKATKQNLCGADKIADSDAETNEKNDVTSSSRNVRAVGAMVLEGHIKAIQVQGEALGAKYGGWKELIEDEVKATQDSGDKSGEGEEAKDSGLTSGDEAGATSTEETKAESSAQYDGKPRAERIAKVRHLVQRIKEAEEELEAAAAREDFDKAAELHEFFQQMQTELEETSLTDEETELAFAEEYDPSKLEQENATDCSPEASPEDDSGNDAVADSKEGVDNGDPDALNIDAEVQAAEEAVGQSEEQEPVVQSEQPDPAAQTGDEEPQTEHEEPDTKDNGIDQEEKPLETEEKKTCENGIEDGATGSVEEATPEANGDVTA